MMSSVEKKILGQGQSLVDKKVAQLQAIELAGSKSLAVEQSSPVPEILQSEHSVAALEAIDEIHNQQNIKLQSGMPMLKDSLAYWAKSNYLPCQMETVMSLAALDARRKDERLENQLTEEDFYTQKDALQDLEKIKKRFNIEIDDDHFNSDQQLFKSFMSMDPHAFFNFKNSSNISRTLVKNQFKPKYKTGIEKRMEEVIRLHDLFKENCKTLERLGKELQQLKQINKSLYLVQKKEYDRVVKCQKLGFPSTKIAEMIAELPESYKPDEQDLALARTMQTFNETSKKNQVTDSANNSATHLQHDDSILSLQQATQEDDVAMNLSREQQPRITDFESQDHALTDRDKKQVNRAQRLGSVIGKNMREQAQSLEQSRTKRRMQKSKDEVKLMELHMKRKIPQLYLSKDLREGKTAKMNEFNSILQSSLLSPKKQRYVTTKHEQDSIDRHCLTSRSRKSTKGQTSTQQETKRDSLMQKTDGDGILPIISVGASINSVDFADSKPSQNGLDSPPASSSKRKRIGQQANRREDSTKFVHFPIPNAMLCNTGLTSPVASGPSIGYQQPSTISSARGAINTPEAFSKQGGVLSPNLRGVSPLIRGHLRDTGNDPRLNVFMTDQQHQESKSTIRALSATKRSEEKLSKVIVKGKAMKNKSQPKKPVDIHAAKPNLHQQSIKEIIQKVRGLRGSDPVSSKLALVSERVKRQMLTQRMRDSYSTETCEQVQQFSDYQPNILKWLFEELQESLEEENETQRTAIVDFERRKLDYKYFQMIENRERSNFNKQINAKKNVD